MKVLMAASEVFPFSKTGGLADVLGALPQALVTRGHEVVVVSPWYANLHGETRPLWIGDVDVPFDGARVPVGVGTLEAGGVRFVFVGHEYFRRERLYGYPDDVHRFALLTRAIPAAAQRVGFLPDVVHAHDWHVGYLPAVLQLGWHLPPGWPGLPSVFTIHNVQYQGFSGLEETTYWLRLPSSVQASGMNHFGAANAMQAALDFAERVTTVSPSYAEEIKQPEYGYGLDGTFRHIAPKLSGILNGLDNALWDPSNDPFLDVAYDAKDLRGKVEAKRSLEDALGLEAGKPLLGVVSRFAEQKGIDLLLEAASGLLEDGWNLVVLGSGEHGLEQAMRHLAASHPSRVAVRLGYDEAHAHRIYAAADALAIPSRFEPCGLTQLIAMRYGTLPIARATGGLRDTIRPGVTGFLFAAASSQALRAAAGEALEVLRDEGIENMRRTAMRERFDWQRAADAYGEVYLAARSDTIVTEPSPSPALGSDFDWKKKLASRQFSEAARLQRLAVDTGLEASDDAVQAYLGWLSQLEQLLHDKAWKSVEAAAETDDRVQPRLEGALFPDPEAVAREATQLAASGAALDQRSPETARPILVERSESTFIFPGENLAQRGTLALMEGDDATAEARLGEAVEAHPRHLRARVNLGNLKLEAGDVTGAIALYEAVLAIDDQYPSALHNLGVAYRKSGNIAKSVRTLRKAAGAQRRSDTRSLRRNARAGSPVRRAQWGWILAISAVLVAWLLVR